MLSLMMMYGVQCTPQVRCTMYDVRCTLYTVHCTVYSVHCIAEINIHKQNDVILIKPFLIFVF